MEVLLTTTFQSKPQDSFWKFITWYLKRFFGDSLMQGFLDKKTEIYQKFVSLTGWYEIHKKIRISK